MKPGYKILIAIGIGIGVYKLVNYDSAQKERLTKEVNKIITDIRREDYFAIQNQLSPKLAQNISIDEIKAFTKDLNLTRDTKFILGDFEKKNSLIKLKGIVVDKNRELPLNLTLKDNNGTLLILKQKLGSRILEPKKGNFPLNIE
jgi:hypothetical protein